MCCLLFNCFYPYKLLLYLLIPFLFHTFLIVYFCLCFFALLVSFNIPLSLVTIPTVIPASIKIITIVTTNAISCFLFIIPYSLISYFSRIDLLFLVIVCLGCDTKCKYSSQVLALLGYSLPFPNSLS